MDNLEKEIKRVYEFNALMKRGVGNKQQLFLQANLLIEEGVKELSEALFEENKIKLRDALADTVVIAAGGLYLLDRKFVDESEFCIDSTTDDLMKGCVDVISKIVSGDYSLAFEFSEVIGIAIGLARQGGIDLVADLAAVNDSNFSKFCQSKEEATQTMAWYQQNHGLSTRYEMTGNEQYPFAIFSAESKGDFLESKLLKSINYKAPEFAA